MIFEVDIESFFEDIEVSKIFDKYNEFLGIWREIEINLKNFTLTESLIPLIDQPYTLNKILRVLVSKDKIPEDFGIKIVNMFDIRNKIVHGTKDLKIDEISEYIEELREIHEKLIHIMNR